MIEPVRIEPGSYYDDGALRQALGLTAATLSRARRTKRLRFVQQGKRVLYRGSWVNQWLEAEAVEAKPEPELAGARPGQAVAS